MQDKEVRLLELGRGKTAVIKQIKGGYGLERRLTSLGVRAGKAVRKVSSTPLKGPIVIEIGSARIAIGRRMAMKVFVEVKK
ncbi:FeoA domain-containing protein [candidate division NPL-UPA2 bacterium]|nr:FeoA domain-containing protein [candidate division NPL-UPA2 bacterium]